MNFEFPKTLQDKKYVWQLAYAPSGGATVMPSLAGSQLQNCYGQWVTVPASNGGVAKVFMVVVDVVLPAVNTSTVRKPAQFMRGIQLFPNQVDPTTVPSEGMAFYIRELDPPVDVAQEFLDALLGTSLEERAREVDTSWVSVLGEAKQAMEAPNADS